MSNVSKISLFLIAVPSVILLVLSYGYIDGGWWCFVHALVSALPWIGVAMIPAALFYFWKKSIKWPLFVFALIYALVITKENIWLSQELDRIAMFSKQADEIHATEVELLQDKKYPKELYGEYAAGLDFIKKTKVYFDKEQKIRNEVMQVVNFHTFYSPEVICSVEELSKLRDNIEAAYKKMRSQYRQAYNYYSNLIRIFNESKWKNQRFKMQLAQHFQPQSDLRLEFIKDLYTNLRDQLFVFDDMIVFFLSRQGHFTQDEKGKISFKSEIDTQKYQTFCRDIDDLLDDEQKIVDKYNADINS